MVTAWCGLLLMTNVHKVYELIPTHSRGEQKKTERALYKKKRKLQEWEMKINDIRMYACTRSMANENDDVLRFFTQCVAVTGGCGSCEA